MKEPLNAPVIVDCYIYYKREGKETHPVQKRYGDEDNLRKALNDALVRFDIISDDKLVVGGETYKTFSDDDCAYVFVWGLSDVFEIKTIGA